MKAYRIFVIVLTFVVSISFGLFCLSVPEVQTAIKDPVTEEYYEMLQNNAMAVATTLDVQALTDETLTADFYSSRTELVVTVESFKAKVVAHIPISNHKSNIEDRDFTFNGSAEFEEVEFEKTSKIQPVWRYVIIIGGMTALIAFTGWTVLYKARFDNKSNSK